MTTLITGGAGYIGSITARAIRASGRAVVVLDTLENGHRKAVGDAPFVQADVADADAVRRTVEEHGVDEVVHFAAYKAVGESMEQPLRYYNNNVAGSIALVHALLANGVERIVFSSSAAVYGNPDHVPVNEDAPLRPESVYAETKVHVERFLTSCNAIGLRSVSLRYFNAAGASADSSIGENWDMSQNLIPLVMKAILGASGPVRVFGNDYPTPDGTCLRDYIHVEDLAQAHINALDFLATGGKSMACNVGTGQASSVLDVLRMAEEVSGRSVPHEIAPRRPGDPTTVFADPTLVRAVLGWRATHDLREIVSSAWRWHSK